MGPEVFKDFIPEGEDTGAVGQGYSDFVPAQPEPDKKEEKVEEPKKEEVKDEEKVEEETEVKEEVK